MTKEKRTYLTKSILVCSDPITGENKRKFFIDGLAEGQGASSVVYKAHHENGGIGILKEFYPANAICLERLEDGQLIASDEFGFSYKKFISDMENYLKPYKLLLEIRQVKNAHLQFIPSFEIYYSCTDIGEIGTVYIWTPEPKTKTFESICNDIRKAPRKNPELNLITVLEAIKELTECVMELHKVGIIHRDIKPSNFAFNHRQKNVKTQEISLFDINSICSVYETITEHIGTPGYTEPEFGKSTPNNKTDIYAIGATLFNALIDNEEQKNEGRIYEGNLYHQLQELVNSSTLITASEVNSLPRLRSTLARILKKCLAKRSERYENCEKLLEDLNTALYYILPKEIVNNNKLRDRWVLQDLEKSLDKRKNMNSTLAMQYHLFEYPLFEKVGDDSQTVNVVILGFRNFGQKFLDACLQTGQFLRKTLNVSVCLGEGEEVDKDFYLKERPGLERFFTIDSKKPDVDSTYGKISFINNANIINNAINNSHYIFISIGSDEVNLRQAQKVRKISYKCSINCVLESEDFNNLDGINPIFINKSAKEFKLYKDIERMAFNTHLIWEKNLNVDLKAVKKEFRKPYNHDSSVASVISLRYKLNAIGINLSSVDFHEAAKLFSQKIFSLENNLRNELICLEHKRWVTEKLCQGWRNYDNISESLVNGTKNEKLKRHICIIDSQPNQNLAEVIGKKYPNWDISTKQDLDCLDGLDQMSVKLHYLYKLKAEKIKKDKPDLARGKEIFAIQSLLHNQKDAIIAFEEWRSCVSNIFVGSSDHVRLYKGLKNKFLKTIQRHSNVKKIEKYLDIFETDFNFILSSQEFRNWKQDDVALIDNIPFILTYSENTYLVIPYSTGNPTKIFSNLAVPTLVNPAKVIYVCSVSDTNDINEVTESLPYVLTYMDKKHIKSQIDLLVIYDEDFSYSSNEVESKIRSINSSRIKVIKHFNANDITTIEKYINERSKGKDNFYLEKKKSVLFPRTLYKKFPSYKFNAIEMKFDKAYNCEMLSYIKKRPYITVSDLFSFKKASVISVENPEFFTDYPWLWEKYSKDPDNWKQLCDVLGNVKFETLTMFDNYSTKRSYNEQFHYILPIEIFLGVEKILNNLIDKKIVSEDSRLTSRNSDSFEIVLVGDSSDQKSFDRLFSKPYLLCHERQIENQILRNKLYIQLDTLEMKRVAFKSKSKNKKKVNEKAVKKNLKFFADKKYINNYVQHEDHTVSFSYASQSIKELMTTEGRILEIYIYHKLKTQGYFDDIVSSCKVEWENERNSNEFDCILTKGYRLLFIECKARPDIQQDFIYKIKGLEKHFGVNSQAVLIADTHDSGKSYERREANLSQECRAEELGVISISDNTRIAEIDRTLIELFKKKYEER